MQSICSWRVSLGNAVLRTRTRRYSYVHVPKKKPPHLLGFGSEWRKCFVVHPHTQVVQPLEKYQWLTGSVLEDGLPDNLPDNQHNFEAEMEGFEERLHEAIRQSPRRWRREDVGRGLLTSALAAVWMTGLKHLQQASLTPDPKVECYWRRSGWNFLCVSHPLLVLHSPTPLQLFRDPAHQPPAPVLSEGHLPRHLRLFEHSFDQITPFGGCHRFSPTPFTHTVFSLDQKAREREQVLAHGLMQLFTQAAAECVQNGYPLDQDLAYPLASQGVVVSGSQLTFLCFQLNTLDLRRGRGSQRHNVVWAGPSVELLSEDRMRVNRMCTELLFRFLLHQPTRKRPSLSGFGLRREAEQQKKEQERRQATA